MPYTTTSQPDTPHPFATRTLQPSRPRITPASPHTTASRPCARPDRCAHLQHRHIISAPLRTIAPLRPTYMPDPCTHTAQYAAGFRSNGPLRKRNHTQSGPTLACIRLGACALTTHEIPPLRACPPRRRSPRTQAHCHRYATHRRLSSGFTAVNGFFPISKACLQYSASIGDLTYRF